MNLLKILAGVFAAIVIGVGLLLVVGMPLGFLTSAVRDRVERDTGYRLAVAGSTRVGLWPSLHVTMSDLTLERPDDRDSGARLAAGSIEADISLASLWSGSPDITGIVINRPTLRIPLRRERRPVSHATSAQPGAAAETDPGVTAIGRVTVNDGTVIFFNAHDRVDERIEGVGARATIDADRHFSLSGNARAGGHPATFNVTAAVPDPSVQRRSVPVELSLDAPGLLHAPLSSKAEVRLNGTLLMINSFSGKIGDDVFDGWASVDLDSKPQVKLDLDFRRLDIATTPPQAAPQDAAAAWSNDPFSLIGLNYVDAQVRLSAAELNIAQAHVAPVALEATLASGILKGTLSNLGAYGGLANGTLNLDVLSDTPVYALAGELSGVRALPLLSGLAGFDMLDGRLQARLDLRSSGESQQAIMSNLSGTVVANFQDGAIRGLNVAQMIRSLTSGALSGWQQGQDKTTDLAQLSASFRIDKGHATTADINLVGPLVRMTGGGTIDLGAKTLALRVEPKLVMTTQGQGRAADPVGIGIPVAIDGPWASPNIYPDIAGGSAGNATGGNSLSDTLGNLIQQGLNAARGRGNQPNASPNDPSANDPSRPAQGGPSASDVLRQLFGR